MRRMLLAMLVVAPFSFGSADAAPARARIRFEDVIRVAEGGSSARGVAAWRRVAVGVTQVASPPASGTPKPSVSFGAIPPFIKAGETSMLSWSVADASRISIDPGLGEVLPQGTRPVQPSSTTTYTLTASGPGGTATAQTTVVVSASAPSISFSVTPASVIAGGGATLTWNTSFADRVEIDNGIGSVAPSGSRAVSPSTTTTYTLTATGSGGRSAATATLTVTPRVDKPDLVARVVDVRPARAAIGDPIEVRVSVSNQGAAAAPGSSLRLLFSSDLQPDPGDAVVSVQPVPPLPVRGSLDLSVTATVPGNATAGARFLIAVADADKTADEADENNNAAYAPITVDAQRQPAIVDVNVFPQGLVQFANMDGAVDSYTVSNNGQSPTTITMQREGSFFQHSPQAFALAPGETKTVFLIGTAQPEGVYEGFSIPTGVGVPALRIRVRLLSTQPPAEPPRIVPVNTRVEIIAPPDQNPVVQVPYRNVGGSTFVGLAVSDVPWIVPNAEILRIAPGETRNVTLMIIRANRPDAALLQGAGIGILALRFPSFGSGLQRTVTAEGDSSDVVIVDVIKATSTAEPLPPVGAGEVAFFMPGIVTSDSTFTNLFVGNRTTLSKEVRLFYGAAGFSELVRKRIDPNSALPLAAVVKANFNDFRPSTLQIRGSNDADLAVAGVRLVRDAGFSKRLVLPILRSNRGIASGDKMFFGGIAAGSEQRARVVVQEMAGFPGSVVLESLDANGRVIAAETVAVPAFAFAQVSGVRSGTVAVRMQNASTSQARFGGYVTVSDQDDQTHVISDITRTTATPQLKHVIPLPRIAASGATADLFISNNTAAAAEISIEVVSVTGQVSRRRGIRPSGDGSDSLRLTSDDEPQTITIASNLVARAELKSTSFGYAVVTAPAGTVGLSGTLLTGDSSRTTLAGVPISAALSSQGRMRFVGVDDVKRGIVADGIPNNSLMLIETAGQNATVRVGLVLSIGGTAATARITPSRQFELRAGEMMVIDDVVRAVLGAARDGQADVLNNIQVDVEVVSSGGARVIPFLQSIESGTGRVSVRAD